MVCNFIRDIFSFLFLIVIFIATDMNLYILSLSIIYISHVKNYLCKQKKMTKIYRIFRNIDSSLDDVITTNKYICIVFNFLNNLLLLDKNKRKLIII